jgi:hypothetical protein
MKATRAPALTCVVVGILAASSTSASGQSLDIGGIELRLGQSISEALNVLSPYDVRYQESVPAWTVYERGRQPLRILGVLQARDGVLYHISKSFDIPNIYATQRVYTQASQEVQRRGGGGCETREVKWTDELIRTLETRCGSYTLTYSLPGMADGMNVPASISIRVSRPPAGRTP